MQEQPEKADPLYWVIVALAELIGTTDFDTEAPLFPDCAAMHKLYLSVHYGWFQEKNLAVVRPILITLIAMSSKNASMVAVCNCINAMWDDSIKRLED